jgi:hypothetical protein
MLPRPRPLSPHLFFASSSLMEPAPRLTLVGFRTAAPDARLKLRRDCSSRSLLSESLVAVQSASPPLSPFASSGHHPESAPSSSCAADAEDASSNGSSFCSYADDATAGPYSRPSSLAESPSGRIASPVAICYDRR